MSPIGLEVRCLSHNLLQVIKKILIYPCFWGSVSEKKSIIYGGFFSFFGCGPVCGGGVSLGAVVGWGRGCCVVGWGCAGASLCRGGPVVGLFSAKFENFRPFKKDWPRGYRGSSIFWHYPPLYRAVAGVVGCGLGWGHP